MAGDITSTIRFIADASQAIGTMRALAAESKALSESVSRVQAQFVSANGAAGFAQNTGQIKNSISAAVNRLSPEHPILGREAAATAAGAYQRIALPATDVVDRYNKTIRTTHDEVIYNSQAQEIFRATLSRTHGQVEKIIEAEKALGEVTKVTGSAINSINNSLATQQGRILDLVRPGQQRVQSIITEKNALKDLLKTQIDTRLNLPTPKPTSFKSSAEDLATARARHAAIAQAEQDIRDTEAKIRSASSRQGAASRSYDSYVKNDPVVQAAQARLAQLQKIAPQIEKAATAAITAGQRTLDRTNNLPPPLPAALETLRQESPVLFNRLTQQGILGDPAKKKFGFVTTPGTVDTNKIYESGADQLRITRNLEKGISSISGTLRTENGAISNVNASWAEGGRVIGRYSSGLSGIQNFLTQTVNNLKKVVQWGLATTAVFAGLALATSGISTIINLDKALNQLSITAQLTATQTKGVFTDLSKIAYDTATPLQELVKAADDIALATKRANQSTQEWQANIKSLASSVGILTNITGIDTVKATDLLTSTMKQLNLTANDLPAILNKAAAVGGGQANSIKDIVSGLGAMAEAAQQASLSLDQTIAVVQVLGQVTSKSSSEIATAFKNLVGSVDSVGAQKALAKYNISVKDEAGNLRNILDIYDEINQKRQQGIIPEADVKGLVKAIAGGPRRAPDAAALLANVDAIKEAAKRAGEATNEALVANAKYLDTIAAKITQIQVKFATFVEKAFGPALKGFVNDLASVLGTVLDILQKFPPDIIQTVLGFTTLLVSIKALSAGVRFLWGGFATLVNGIRLFNAAGIAATEQFKLTGTTAQVAAVQEVTAGKAVVAALDAQIIAYTEAALAAREFGTAEEIVAADAALAAASIRRAAAVTAASAIPTAAAGAAAGIGSKFLKVLPGAAIGAGVGAALPALTGGSPGEIAGGALLGSGVSLFASPIPIPHLKLLAGAMILAGGALSLFTGKSKEAETSQVDLSQEVLTSVQQYKEARDTVVSLTSKQGDLTQQYHNLSGGTKQTVADVGALNDALLQYVGNVQDLRTANEALSASFQDIGKEGAKATGEFAAQIAAAQAGNLDPQALKALQDSIYQKLFKVSNTDLNPTPVPFTTGSSLSGTGTKATFGNTSATDSLFDIAAKVAPGAVPQSQTAVVDLKNLKDASEILQLFNNEGTQIVGTFDHSSEAVDQINKNLQITVDKGGELGVRALVAQKTFKDLVATFDSLANAELFGKQQDTLLQTKTIIGSINAEQAKQGEANIKIYKDLITLSQQLPSAGPSGSEGSLSGAGQGRIDSQAGSSQEAQNLARTLLVDQQGNINTGKASIETARKLVEQLHLTDGLGKDIKLTNDQVYNIATKYLGIQVSYTSEQLKQISNAQELADIQQNIFDQSSKDLDTLASKSASVQKQYLSGDITKKQRDARLQGLTSTKKLDDSLGNLLTNLAENQPALDAFEEKLGKIPGLENLVGAKADVASQLLKDYFDSMELTGKGASGLTEKVLALITTLGAIPASVQSEINLDINTRVHQSVDQLPGLTALGPNASKDELAARQKVLDSIKKQAGQDAFNNNKSIQSLLKQIQGFAGGIGGIGSKNGTSFLGTDKKKAAAKNGPDVSQIDLPDEIANATNRSALIQEAIKRARALQKTIPGAVKEGSNDIVALLKGTQNILNVRGVKDDLLRRALEELAAIEKKKLDFETKADIIQRIRIGTGDFSAIANVPLNSKTGVSQGGPNNINITLGVNGQILTPAQLSQFADLVASALKRQIAQGG